MSIETKAVSVSTGPSSMWLYAAFTVLALAIGIVAGLFIGRVTASQPSTAAGTEAPAVAAPATEAASVPFTDYALRHAATSTAAAGSAVLGPLDDYALRHASTASVIGTISDPLDDYALRHSAVGDAGWARSDDYALRHAG